MIIKIGRTIFDKGPNLIICKMDNSHHSYWSYLKRRASPLSQANNKNLFYSEQLKKHIFLIEKSAEEEGFVRDLEKIRNLKNRKIYLITSIKSEKKLMKLINQLESTFKNDGFEFYISSLHLNLSEIKELEFHN